MVTKSDPTPWHKLLLAILRLLAWPYRLAIWMRNRAYDSGLWATHPSPLPTISVGNLSVGGTGKSPFVSWLAKSLRQQDVRVAILSRGYGELDDGRNDEALELELLLPDVPHLQDRDRVQSARVAHDELAMESLILDDGFQHRRISRDLDIVLIDASEPPHCQTPLPGGLFREPFRSLRRADVVVLTRCDQASPQQLESLNKKVLRHLGHEGSKIVVRANHRPQELVRFQNASQTVEFLNGKSVAAFCGIGNPDSFFDSLTAKGAILQSRKTWPDHHPYSFEDVRSLEQWLSHQSAVDLVVCTVKDWVKLRTGAIGGVPLYALQIAMQLESQETELLQVVMQAVDRRGDQD